MHEITKQLNAWKDGDPQALGEPDSVSRQGTEEDCEKVFAL